MGAYGTVSLQKIPFVEGFFKALTPHHELAVSLFYFVYLPLFDRPFYGSVVDHPCAGDTQNI